MDASCQLIDKNDDDYPHARYRRTGMIELRLEVVHDDPDGNALAAEMFYVVSRALNARGCDVWGESSAYEPLPLVGH